MAGGSWLVAGLGAGGWWLVATEPPATGSVMLALGLVAGGSWRAAGRWPAPRVWLLLLWWLVAGGWWLVAGGSWLCTANYRELPAVIGIPGNSLVITKPPDF